MIRKLTLICALLGLVALVAGPAYAEVQNIKVSGDITAMGVYREAYDLQKQLSDESDPDLDEEDQDSFLMSILRLRIDADLTDNVGATVRLVNAREWDAVAETLTNDNENDINVNLAYVTLKEMLYSPLTLVIGRQDLLYGTGLIIGPTALAHDPSDSIQYDDLVSHVSGYDAVRAILDYDPWTLDLLYAKIFFKLRLNSF